MQRHRKPHWFRRKWYGWGRYPVSRQGWVVTLGFLGLAILRGTTLPASDEELAQYGRREYLGMYAPFVVMIAGIIFIGYLRGEKPKRQWGRPKSKKSDKAE